MNQTFSQAMVAGTERVAGWADLLDRINVFPVADGDTGRNLVLSLSPLLQGLSEKAVLCERLLLSARGNSGNIAAQFLTGLLEATSEAELPGAVKQGNDLAWKAVPDPREGTMLSLFIELTRALDDHPPGRREGWERKVIDRLEATVKATTEQLPKLQRAGVVDSGALGMFLFLDGFLNALAGREGAFRPVADTFKDQLRIAASWEQDKSDAGCCIDAVLEAGAAATEQMLRELGDSVVAVRHGGLVKVHLHADDEQVARNRLADLGTVVSWAADDLHEQTRNFRVARGGRAIHVMTDAAGSVTHRDARELEMTVLHSYINLGTRSVPETHLDARDLYGAMRAGTKVSTSQASNFERHQHYERIMALNRRALYLCVGSAYTGNYETVTRWKVDHDPDDRLTVIDSGAASGRLGLAALATADFARRADDPEVVVEFARKAVVNCREYVFLDRLEYLAAGGRLSKTKAFFGDMLSKKPVISPLPEGASKMAVLKNQEEQVAYAMARLAESVTSDVPHLFMLEYTDNADWVVETVGGRISRDYPGVDIKHQRFSLTSGAHMGPGTWGLAFLPLPR